ncbi:RNA polymerase sigma-70 factor, ECF subfamily [Paenibacillus sp. cl141a]|uniref:hypothetical protein n=1 Tax=Paenibacillus sp. cl141a TaxID=1761877 RepID=UPI0008C054F6|nr:hypothetical protein [Paenibacillus sp. cl141a]SEK25005.1 RNA polymerase sigma-70 factor, ECF subfamily [Paenibacillus sp. cl141a]
MTKINLRDYYPFCNHDIFLEIPHEVATVLLEAERQEEAYRRRMYRHKAQYSLDRGDGIEHDMRVGSVLKMSRLLEGCFLQLVILDN